MRQQRVQQQEEEAPDHLHERAAGGAGEGVPENPLPRCLCAGAAGHEDGANGGQGTGTVQPSLPLFFLLLLLLFFFLRTFFKIR